MVSGEFSRIPPATTPGRKMAATMLKRHAACAALGLHRIDVSAMDEHIAFHRVMHEEWGRIAHFDSLRVDLTLVIYLDRFDDPLDAACEFGSQLAEILKEHGETVPSDFCVGYIYQRLVDDYING